MAKQTTCSVEGCTNGGQITRRMCNKHYARFKVKHPELLNTPTVPQCYEYLLRAIEVDTDECIIWPYATSVGYGTVGIPGAKGKSVPCHRLACELKNGPPPSPKHFARHGPCHNRACFNPRHISWGTAQQNSLDQIRDGTICRGENSANARLTERQIRQIRQLKNYGYRSVDIAREFGITARHLRNIVARTSWKHVT